VRAGGFGPILAQPSRFTTTPEFLHTFFPSLTAMVGFWATLSLNIPDFTRYARSQKDQVLGQALGLPPTMTLYAFIGVAVTSATALIFPGGHVVWDPVELLGKIGGPLTVLLSMVALSVATLTTNLAANVVSPANDFANAFPKWISFRTGGLITGIVGILMQPWRLLADPSGYIFAWLVGYSGGLGSIAGVLVIDYWVIRKKQLALGDLYTTEGRYAYRKGWNWRAVVATVIGCLLAWIGIIFDGKHAVYLHLRLLGQTLAGFQWPLPSIPWLHAFYDFAWFIGFGAAALSYWLLMKAFRPQPALAEPATA